MVSVTTILDYLTDKQLLGWIENNSKAKRKAISEEALRIGTEVDLLVQQDIKEGGYLLPEGDSKVESCMMAWEKYKEAHPSFMKSIISIQNELIMGDIVGHPDIIVERDGCYGIVDIKTSRSIYPRYWVQTAQYSEMFGKTPRFITVLLLDKETGLWNYQEIRDESAIQYEVSVFNAYYEVYKHSFNNREIIRQQLELEVV